MQKLSKTEGFTLPELLTVIAIIGLLMGASFGALFRARALAKRTKAEAQLRELVNAWRQYYTTYGSWPNSIADRTVSVNDSNIKPLIDPDDGDNEYGIVFLNTTTAFKDPWGTEYRLTFGSNDPSNKDKDRNLITFETTVALPERK